MSRDKWTLKDSEHSVRDTWTALYANRHSFKEVIMWFQDKGLRYQLIDAKAFEEKLGMWLPGIGIRGAPEAYFEKLAGKEEAGLTHEAIRQAIV